MVDKELSLYQFLVDHSEEISNGWYDTIIEDDPDTVYASTDPHVIKGLKAQNLSFNYLINRIFNKEELYFYQEIKNWAISIAEDKEHQRTPIYKVIREFTRVRNLYHSYIKRYCSENEISTEQLEKWKERLTDALDFSINLFVEETYHASERQIHSQKMMIYELSSPVILLHKGAALLPLIGDIDTGRAKIIMESSLQQCTEKNVSHLFIDLSGVHIIDTMVAHQISQLMTALKLIGVQTTLSGIRPEIAQTSIQLGITFKEGKITSTLAQALSDSFAAIK